MIRLCVITIFSIPVILVATSAFGQFYASQKRFLPNSPDKKFAVNSNVYIEIKAINDENYNSLTPASVLPFENTGAPVVNDSSSLVTEAKKANSEASEISFRATSFVYPVNSTKDIGVSEYSTELLIIYAEALKEYAKKNDFDTSYAFLSNMGMLCNKKRFFVVNLVTMEIEQAGLVSHGRGKGATIYDKQYSDEPGSRCTSLGRYEILGKYKGKYGESYRMIGLDSSNTNAYDRNIVLHSMSCIPEIENLMPACVSDGCPAVSGKFLSALRQIIDSRKAHVAVGL